MFDAIIIGGGMAGMTSCLYLLRNNKKVLLLEKEVIGGQIASSPKVENYPTIKEISGEELSSRLFEQISELGAEFELEEAQKIEKRGNIFCVTTDYNTYEAKSVILATGVKPKKLGLENEDKLLGKGIYYCAICDGPFYKDKDVTVIGDANSALQYALLLADYCKSVTIITLFDKFFGEECLQKSVLSNEKIKVIHNLKGIAANGEDKLESVTFKRPDGSTYTHITDAVFIAIGQVPNNKMFEDLADIDKNGYFISNERCLTKTAGLFVAGDTREKETRQVTTAIGDGATAAMAVCKFLSLGEK